MKQVLSISLEEGTIIRLKNKLRHSHSFRNQSHLVEYAIEKLLCDSNENPNTQNGGDGK